MEDLRCVMQKADEDGCELVREVLNIQERILETQEKLVSSAFVDGDTDSHRRYHEEIVRRNEELRRLRMAIQEKTLSALIWVVVVWLGAKSYEEFGRVVRAIMGK